LGVHLSEHSLKGGIGHGAQKARARRGIAGLVGLVGGTTLTAHSCLDVSSNHS
jgi:hypothetical protein